jgi:branched-chain amino acid transport system substrate-binding protein
VALGLVLLIAFLISSRISFYPRMRERREHRALTSTGPVRIAAVWPREQGDQFINGVRMAVEEINANHGAGGRTLIVDQYEEPTIRKGLAAARTIGRNLDYVAVVGHFRREVALPASITYETTGVLFLVTGTTSHVMTQHGFQYVLQTSPEDTQLARLMADTSLNLNLKRMAVVFVRSIYGEQFARSFVEALFDTELEIVFWSSYPETSQSFLPIIAQLRSANPEGIVIIDGPQRAEILIRQIRMMGIDIPILGGPTLEQQRTLDSLGSAAENLYVLSPFWNNNDSEEIRTLAAEYQRRYGDEPNYEAALAYEVVMLLAQVIAKTGETAPITMVTNLKYGGQWQCLDGPCSFLSNGLIAEREIFVKVAQDGRFIKVETIGGS